MQIKTNFEFVRSKIATAAGEVVNDISDKIIICIEISFIETSSKQTSCRHLAVDIE